jgi:hypothetical protein
MNHAGTAGDFKAIDLQTGQTLWTNPALNGISATQPLKDNSWISNKQINMELPVVYYGKLSALHGLAMTYSQETGYAT